MAAETPYYAISSPLGAMHECDNAFPANMKLVPWFSTVYSEDDIVETARTAAEGLSPFVIEGGGEACFSAREWRRTRLVGSEACLASIHQHMLEKVSQLHPHFNRSTNLGENYVPHVSLKRPGSNPRWMRRGDRALIDTLYVMRHDTVQVIGEIKLDGATREATT